MNLEKFNKILKIFIIVLTISLIVGVSTYLIVYNIATTKEEPIEEHKCTKLGQYCSEQDIYNGVEVEIAVSKNKTQRFYVISNTSTTMTLLMKKNISKETDWHSELLNINGPDEAMRQLVERTKSWKNIDVIEDYSYTDSGLTTYETNCQNNTTEPNYDCSTKLNPTRGYYGLTIKNGELVIKSNFDGSAPEHNIASSVKARLITAEEIENLVYYNKLPKWLISNLDKQEGYWTLTSSTAIKTNYSQGAIALANVEKLPSIESLFVKSKYETKYDIGLRPVITVAKEAGEDQGKGH